MACTGGCHREQISFDPESPGVVSDDEIVCRAGYGKKAHYNASGIRPNIIRFEHLVAGELSVWRLPSNYSQDALDSIVEINEGHAPAKNELWDVFGMPVHELRALRVASIEGRPLSVIDDVRTGNGKDPRHAALALCEGIDASDWSKSHPAYIEIQDEILRIMKSNVVWKLPR